MDYHAIEEHWKKKWDEEHLYTTDIRSSKPKLYLLVEFPYPSGAGLHMGHMRSYTAMDVIARKKRREGYEVLFPIGYDAFGLPAENYAIKTGIHPKITTKENIDNFRKQMKACGFSFDWDREVDTTDPSYYKWTQWIFLKLYEKGLAYKREMPVNWCPKDKCVLANEEVIDGRCERCGTPVEKKNKKQWMLAITKYAERLAKDLDETEYLDKIKIQQRNWIGLSEGSEIDFVLKAGDETMPFTIFTTRADTIFGCTYCVLAPEHAIVKDLLDKGLIGNADEVRNYKNAAMQKLDMDRSAEGKEKTGVQLEGVVAINPASKEDVPVFVADYVLPQYGTGAIMAVPAHDERDYEFAARYKVPVKEVIQPMGEKPEGLYTDYGILFNSGAYDGLASEEAKKKITNDLGGRIVVKSKLRDWVFARQRYWGEPTPIVYDEEGSMYPVHESNLPVVLPDVAKFEPTENGESPLYQVPEWVNVKGYIDEKGYFHEDPSKDQMFKRETDTMPQWAGSSWYFMRYIDPHNDAVIGDPELLKHWLPVDWYNGGMEHTTLHLLYSRFWYKFLYDIGVVPNSEPYFKRTSQGMILGEGGVKMSKSLGNVVNPDDIIKEFGADVLRTYEMFLGPFDQSVSWDGKAIVGVERFLEKVEKIALKVTDNTESLPITHQTIKKVSEGIDAMQFNTCISQLMICVNEYEKSEKVSKADFESFVSLLAPFAPFMTEEFWKNLGNHESVHKAPWPTHEEALLVEKTATIAIQVGGRLRGTIELARDMAEMNVLDEVKKTEIYQKYVGESAPKKVIFVPNKLINIVI